MEDLDGGIAGAKEEVGLPKATIAKVIKELLPEDVRVANDTRDIIAECCVEFINLLASEANEICAREDKRTIAPEHVLKALESLGFNEYLEEVNAAYEQHKAEALDSPRARFSSPTGMTEEEAIAAQQRMFAEARARMRSNLNPYAGDSPKPP
eukprot:jgi/Chlat1/4367/Chrsp29S04514